MSEPILHHYPSSPFAEKVRLVLGAKALPWRSVFIPTVMPKPDLVALTGGYRKTPVLQIGADIYCDTALICRVLDALQPEPPLYPRACAGLAELIAQWGDQQLFWTAVSYTMQPAGLAHVFGDLPPEALKAFAADRAAYAPNQRRATPADAQAALTTMLGWMEAQLGHQSERLSAEHGPWLAGPACSVADFACAHPLWFVRMAPPVAGILDGFPRVGEWLQRMLSLGHGPSTRMKSADAIDVAATSAGAGLHAPVFVQPDAGFEAGAAVTVCATDVGLDPVAGRLVGLTIDRVTVERVDERAGRVHVHFPRMGYQIKAARQETPA